MSVERTGRGKGFIDLFWPRTLIVEQKSAVRDLFGAERASLYTIAGDRAVVLDPAPGGGIMGGERDPGEGR